MRIRPELYFELCQVRLIFRFFSAVDSDVTGDIESGHDRYHDTLQVRVPHLHCNASTHMPAIRRIALSNQDVFSGNDIAHFEFARRPAYPGDGRDGTVSRRN